MNYYTAGKGLYGAYEKGNRIVISHVKEYLGPTLEKGYWSEYNHVNDKVQGLPGRKLPGGWVRVEQGDTIGFSGRSPEALGYGAHLDFRIYDGPNAMNINPPIRIERKFMPPNNEADPPYGDVGKRDINFRVDWIRVAADDWSLPYTPNNSPDMDSGTHFTRHKISATQTYKDAGGQ